MKNEKFGAEQINALLDATMKILTAGKGGSKVKTIHHEMYFISSFIRDIVERSIEVPSRRSSTTEEDFQRAKAQYENIKRGLQEAVALGFQSAMQHYSNTHIEYYCLIKTVPETKNNQGVH